MAAVDEIVRLVVSYDSPGSSVAQNVFYWLVTVDAITDSALLTTMDTWVDTAWGNLWDNNTENSWTMFKSEVDILNNDGTVKRNIGENSHAVVGTDTAGAVAAGVAQYIQASTTDPRKRGRKFIPGTGEGSMLDGYLSASCLANMVLMLALYVAELGTAPTFVLVPGILSKVDQLFYEFTGGGYASDVPAYQRRRKPNVGS